MKQRGTGFLKAVTVVMTQTFQLLFPLAYVTGRFWASCASRKSPQSGGWLCLQHHPTVAVLSSTQFSQLSLCHFLLWGESSTF